MELNLNLGTTAWYCWQAQPKREHRTAELVKIECGLETYCPRLRYDKKTVRGIVKWVEPLFPGYLFVRCDLGENLRRILSIGAITRLVTAGSHAPIVPDAFIDGLRERLELVQNTVDDPELKPEQEVTIAFGPFRQF
ncbi:MAG: transcription/translation regulatory transformer protein RfaH [Verrucomicrobia bacterium]|nr:transcription/translation regulatory transformer protein RfaH [Verrucomicrobiota bacterium]